MKEEKYMRRCIQLAKNGLCNVSPNPMVGAVIVCEGQIIGEGYHIRCGEAHAEVNAIRSVKDPSLLKHSTIYVSLEPCSHHGKTPPCADLIIEKQIPRIVIGCQDPFSKVAGKRNPKVTGCRMRSHCRSSGNGMSRTYTEIYHFPYPSPPLHRFEMGRISRWFHRPGTYGRTTCHIIDSSHFHAGTQKKSRVGRYHGRYANRTTGQSGTHGTQLVRTQSGANSDGP